MDFSALDIFAFLVYFLLVGVVAVLVSRREKRADDYFLAGRNLPWWLIGISLIASNISTEHFVGMAGSGVDFGLAIASYEWMAAVTLVIVARWFLPKFLALGITTMPQYPGRALRRTVPKLARRLHAARLRSRRHGHGAVLGRIGAPDHL